MKTLKIIEKIFFPEKCAVCGSTLKINEESCLCCGSDEQRLSDDCCEHCGLPKDSCCCESRVSAPVSHITGVFHYDGLIQCKLLNYKFGRKKELYKFFGDALSERVAVSFSKADFDVATFVPSSENTIKERGYDQCELISKRVSEKLFLPHKKLLIKAKITPKQHKLTAKERMTNVIGSFAIREGADVKGKTILICDDIKTTGATLKECADVLLAAGAKDVYCAAVAVTGNLVSSLTLDKEIKNT